MEAFVEQAGEAGSIIEFVILSLLLLGSALFVQRQARVMRRTEDLGTNADDE
jgi:hypothetical protein